MVYPCPGKATLCDEDSVYSMIKKNGSTCFLCEQCNICPNFRGKPFCVGNIPHFPKNLDNSDRCLKDYQPVASRDDTVYYPTQQWASLIF